jgi:3-oxoacyl-[acyl-carrier protein] reductase
LYDRVIAAFGTLDVVVNNAGVHGPIGSIDKVDWDAWVEAIAVNLCGTAYSCRRAVVAFKSAARHDRRGKIINLSGGGATSPQPGLTAYGASKAGLVRLTETLAGEVREFGIDVNAVAPGALATRLTLELRDAGPDRIGAAYFEKVEASLAEGGTPTARATDLILFLASAASDGITGRLISAVWDDWQAWPRHLAELAESDVYTLRRIAGRDRGIPWGDK